MQSSIKHLLKHFALVLKAKLNQLKPFVLFVFQPSTLLHPPINQFIKGLRTQTFFTLLYASFSCPYFFSFKRKGKNFFSDNPQINLPKRWLIQKLFFSLLRIDGPLVSRFDYKVFTSVTKRICKLSVVLIFLLVTIYPESFIHLFIFYHFHYEHLCWKP